MSSAFLRTARSAAKATALGLLAAAPLAFVPRAARAQDSIVLTTAVPFLQIEPDSRSAGMGMTGVALADNAYAVFWNPAGLGQQTGTEVSFTHAPWLPALGADLSYEYLVAKHSLGNAGTLGGHFTYFNLGEQQATDELGNSLGDFRSYELSTGLSYGKQITPNLSVGTGARFIYSNLTGGIDIGPDTPSSAAASFGVDLGVIYKGPELGFGQSARPSVAFSLANLGPGVSYTQNAAFSDAIPTTLRFGGALDTRLDDFNRITLALDFNKVLVHRDSAGSYDSPLKALASSWGTRTVNTRAGQTVNGVLQTCDVLAEDLTEGNECSSLNGFQQLTVGAGLEYWYNDLLALRGGYFFEDPANGNRQFLTAGAGIRYNLVGVDMSYIYALSEDSPVANQLRFSLLLNIPR